MSRYIEEKEKNQVIEVFRKDLPENVNIVCMIRDDFERNFDFVSKDKIREKIEELKEPREITLTDEKGNSKKVMYEEIYNDTIKILEKILEEN